MLSMEAIAHTDPPLRTHLNGLPVNFVCVGHSRMSVVMDIEKAMRDSIPSLLDWLSSMQLLLEMVSLSCAYSSRPRRVLVGVERENSAIGLRKLGKGMVDKQSG